MSDDEIMDVNENEDASSSSEPSDDEEDQKLEERAKELEAELLNNKFLYDAHVELVTIYEKISDLNSFHDAFQRFSECFPLTSELWLKWIKVEIPLATSDNEKENISKLFERAVEDYLSVNLWQEYAQFTMDVSDLENTRKVLERAVNSAGLHTSDGSLLWDFLREIELATLSVPQKDSPEYKEQVEKVVEVFRRQLSVPLLGMENTFVEWKSFAAGMPEIDTKPVEWGYEKALKKLQTYKVYEEELLQSEENEKLEIYTKYIDFVKDPSTVICLYERAVSQFCLHPPLWLDYVNYTFKLGELAFKTVEKALRNCPWSEELWVAKLRVLEHLSTMDEAEVLGTFEKGLSSILPSPGELLWISYIEYVHRNVKDTEKLCKLIERAVEQGNSSKFYARLLAKCGKIKEATAVFKNSPEGNRNNLTFWIDYIGFVKEFETHGTVRSLFQRALNSCKEHAVYFGQLWLDFEREFGTLQNVMKCIEITTKIPAVPLIEETVTEVRVKRKNNTPLEKPVIVKKFKKAVPEPVKLIKPTPFEKIPARTVFLSNLDVKITEDDLRGMFENAEHIEVIRDRKGKSRCFAYVQFRDEIEVAPALQRDRELLQNRPVFISECKPDKTTREIKPFKYTTEFEEKKLFVRGLPKKMSQEDVDKLFKPYGATETRLVLHKSGQSKGLAYVDFNSSEDAKKAIMEMDQREIDGFQINVAFSAPPPKKAQDEHVEHAPIRHARSRLQVPLIPRIVATKTENGATTVKKSNEDFRKMLQ